MVVDYRAIPDKTMKNAHGRLLCFSNRALLSLLAIGIAGAIASPPAEADLLFSDSFNYPVGSLAGNGPPPGSPPGQGGWIALGLDPQVTAPGLRFRRITAIGNAVTLQDTNDATGDTAAAGIAPIQSGIVWIGFLMRRDGVAYNTGFGTLTFNDGFGPTAPQFGVIFFSGRYGIDNSVVPQHKTLTQVAASASTLWLVAKLDFKTGLETLFVNPSRVGEPSAVPMQVQLAMEPEFQASGISRIVLKEGYSIGSFTFDELRVGTSFSDLTP